MTQASICTIGDEILIGQIIDTNSSHISRALGAVGVRVRRMESIGDERDEIIGTLSGLLSTDDIVITTGGLGPTKDDITKDALASLTGSKGYVVNEEQLQIVHEILKSRGLDVLDINLAQASVPDTCEVIPNRKGTAPIMVFRIPESRFGHKCTLYSLPGVPFEAIAALDEVIADIKAHNPLTDIHHRTVMTFGVAESALAKMIATWEDALPEDMHLAYLPNMLTGVRLRLSIYGGDREEQEKRIDAQILKLKEILGDVMYSGHDDTLEAHIGDLLRGTGLTVSAAESCTGGLVSNLLASVPGASEYYLGSVTSYANSVKEGVLGVSPAIISEYGAVSSECVAQMAEGVRRMTGSTFAVATSGIAGPGGGSDDKPVGLVWVGVASPNGVSTAKFLCKGDRKRNMERFASSALDTLRKSIESYLNR